MAKKPARFEVYPTPGLVEAIDRWRAKQDGLPPRADAARRLLVIALTAEGERIIDPNRLRTKAAPRRPRS